MGQEKYEQITENININQIKYLNNNVILFLINT